MSTLASIPASSPSCSCTHPSNQSFSSERSRSSFRFRFSSTIPSASSSLPLASSLFNSTSSTFFRLSSALCVASIDESEEGSVLGVSFCFGAGVLRFVGSGGAGGALESMGGAFVLSSCLAFSAMVWFIFSNSSWSTDLPAVERSASLSAAVAFVSAPRNCFCAEAYSSFALSMVSTSFSSFAASSLASVILDTTSTIFRSCHSSRTTSRVQKYMSISATTICAFAKARRRLVASRSDLVPEK